MAYNWQDGEIITAEKLNQTGGILVVNAMYDSELHNTTLDKTWQEIYDADFAIIKTFIPTLEANVQTAAFWDFVRECDPTAFTLRTSNSNFYATDADSYPTSQGGGNAE